MPGTCWKPVAVLMSVGSNRSIELCGRFNGTLRKFPAREDVMESDDKRAADNAPRVTLLLQVCCAARHNDVVKLVLELSSYDRECIYT
jgi:hypothetical protein